MTKMIYTSKRGTQIVFDDYVDNTKEFNSYWVEMCPQCYQKYRDIIRNKADDGGTAPGTCSVAGCENEADYYVDFNVNEVSFAKE